MKDKNMRDDAKPICYCFDFYRHDIARELAETGRTTIPDFIRRQIKDELCACETMNPSGRCCLGDILQAVKEITK